MKNILVNITERLVVITMEPPISYIVDDALIAGVITRAVGSEPRRPGIWQDMISALKRGAAKSEHGTAEAFLFQAMVDRLLEEFHTEEK